MTNVSEFNYACYNTFSCSSLNRFWYLWWTWYWKGDWWDSVPKSSDKCKIQNHWIL